MGILSATRKTGKTEIGTIGNTGTVEVWLEEAVDIYHLFSSAYINVMLCGTLTKVFI